MEILITNDDGYKAKGIHALAGIMRKFGHITAIAPKKHQSGMGMAVDLGLKQTAYRDLGVEDDVHWSYLDGTPASCVKMGLFLPFRDRKPDWVVCGINHGSNATTGSCYSGTLGAAQEAALNGIPAIGVSLDSGSPDADFSAVEALFPDILRRLMDSLPQRKGIYYNVNFPNRPLEEIRGVRVATQGHGHWEKEFTAWNPDHFLSQGITAELLGRSTEIRLEEGEELYMMTGTYVDEDNVEDADHHLLAKGYVTIVAHNLYTTDFQEVERLRGMGMESIF